VRAQAGWVACAGLGVLLPLSPAGATQPIVDYRPPRAASTADTSVERLAKHAESAAFTATNTGVLVGLGLMLVGIPAGSGGVFLAGYGVAAVGAIAGPTAGWSRAGYPGRGAVGVLVRTGLIAGCIAIPLSSKSTRESDTAGLVVASAALTGVVLATFEAYFECDAIGAYVRRNGTGPSALRLTPAASPSGAPGLALVIGFP
jgi:hypothetical protein